MPVLTFYQRVKHPTKNLRKVLHTTILIRMTAETYVEIFEDSRDRRGRKHFLEENGLHITPDAFVHAISYSLKEKDLVVELFLDEICRAISFHFPAGEDEFRKIVTQVLTEELLCQFCLQEIKSMLSFEGERWVGELLAASIIDGIVAEMMNGSYSKTMRERSAHRLLSRFTR